MDIGTCLCVQGWNGARCKHQAAVAKKYKICSLNLAPFYSKEMRQMFAILAMCEGSTMDAEFYDDLRGLADGQTFLEQVNNQITIVETDKTLPGNVNPRTDDSSDTIENPSVDDISKYSTILLSMK